MQLEIADVLEPLYRTGEEWEKLHRIHEVQLGRLTDVDRAAGAAAAPGRDRRAQAGRSGRGVRLVGGGGQGGPVVGAGARRAAAPGARDPPVGRVRHARCSSAASPEHAPAVRRDVLLRLARQLRERPRQPGTRRGARWCRCWASTRRTRRRWRRWIASTRARGCTRTWPAILRQRLTITDDSDELVQLNLRLGRVLRRGAGGDRSGDRQLPGGAGAASRARATRWTRSSGCTSAASAGRSCTASTRSWSTS